MVVTTFKTNGWEQKIPFLLTTNQRALIYTVGDVHYGDPGFPEHTFIEALKWACDRGAYFIGVGDYLDFTAYSQRKLLAPLRENVRQQIDGMLREQAQKLADLLAFTKGRWIGMIEGNHRWDFFNGTSVDQYLCDSVNCPFLGSMALVRLIPKDMPKNHPEASAVICVHHGIGTARLIGSHLHRLEDMLKWVNADIYIMGHSHAKLAAPIDEQSLTPDGIHYHRTKLIVRSGAWLKGYDSHEPIDLDEPAFMSRGNYVEEKAYMPSSLGGVCIGVGYEKIHRSEYYRPTIHFSI